MARKRGSVYQRGDGYWTAAVSAGAVKGKRYRRVGYGINKHDATSLLSSLRDEVENAASPDAVRLTVGDYATRWLDDIQRPTLRYSSYLQCEHVVRTYLIPFLGHVRLPSLTPVAIQGYYVHLQNRGVPTSMVRATHKQLRSMLAAAVRSQLLKRNPCASVSVPRHSSKERTVWTAKQVIRFLHVAKTDRYHALYVLAIATGMRQGELLGLQWDDIDIKTGVVTVRRSLGRVKGGYGLVEPKTRSSRRTIPIPPYAVACLREHRKQMTAEGYDGGFVFVSQRHKHTLKTMLLDASFHPLIKSAKLPQIRFHDLRHTSATLLMAAGVGTKVVADRLGHSRPSLTLDVYTHAVPNMQKDAARRLDKLFKRLGLSVPTSLETIHL